jgi:hypothetical protein
MSRDSTGPIEHCCACAKAEDAVNVSAWGITEGDRPLTSEQAELQLKAIRYLENRFSIPVLGLPKFDA